MSEQQREASTPSAVVRAEQLLDGVEQSIKFFFAAAGQRVQQTTASLQEKTSQTIQSSTTSQEQPASSAGSQKEVAEPPLMERAEKLVGDTGQRLGVWTSVAGLQMQRVTARTYENVQDFWAEAQDIRRSRSRQ